MARTNQHEKVEMEIFILIVKHLVQRDHTQKTCQILQVYVTKAFTLTSSHAEFLLSFNLQHDIF